MGRRDVYPEIKEREKVETVFSETTSFDGVLKFNTSIKIEGKFKGRILSTGTLIVGENAKVKANIKAKSVIIAGEVRGNIEASERLELLPTARLYGNIKTKKLKMADGVIFEGSCEMLSRPGGGEGLSGITETRMPGIGEGGEEEEVTLRDDGWEKS